MAASGYCGCGCGKRTSLSTINNARLGLVKGEPMKYLRGHHGRRSPVDYLVNAETGCWEWQLQRDKDGYGCTGVGGQPRRAHRVLYERAYGPIPEGLVTDHLCRNPGCVNPDHLELVTVAENTRRGRSGKLTKEAVYRIRSSAERNVDLARRFGVDPSTISHLRRGRGWVEVQP